MNGADFGMGGLAKLVLFLMVVAALAVVFGSGSLLFWLLDVHPGPWLGWACGGVTVGAVSAAAVAFAIGRLRE